MGIFKPIWMTKKYEKREKAIAAVRKISDQDTLLLIAQTAPKADVRQTAVEGITDQKMLGTIVNENTISEVRGAALKRVSDPSVLYDIAMKGGVRGDLIIGKISDKAALYEIAAGSKRPDVSAEAVGKLGRLKDGEALINLIESGSDKGLKTCAMDAIRRNFNLHKRNGTEDKSYFKSRDPALPEDLYARLVKTVESDREGWFRESLYSLSLTKDDLQSLSMGAARRDIRNEAFRWFVSEPAFTPKKKLPGIYASAVKRRSEAQAAYDREGIDGINKVCETLNKRLDGFGKNDVDLLLELVRNVDDLSLREKCCSVLFRDDMNDADGIWEARDEAVGAFLTSYEERRANDSETQRSCGMREPYICQFANMLPPDARSRYGFVVKHEETADSDEFGNYTYVSTTVTYKGRRYYT